MMNNEIVNSRLKESVAIVLIGDGVVALADPKRHARLWQGGPEVWQNLIKPFIDRPYLTQILAVLEIGFGMWLASRQKPAPSQFTS